MLLSVGQNVAEKFMSVSDELKTIVLVIAGLALSVFLIVFAFRQGKILFMRLSAIRNYDDDELWENRDKRG